MTCNTSAVAACCASASSLGGALFELSLKLGDGSLPLDWSCYDPRRHLSACQLSS